MTEKTAVLETLVGSWCVLVVAKGFGRSQALLDERGIVVEVSSERVEFEQGEHTRSYALGELRGIKRPNGEVIANWDGGHARGDRPELQTLNDVWGQDFSFSAIRRRYAKLWPRKARTIVILALGGDLLAIVLRSTPVWPFLAVLGVLYSVMALMAVVAKRYDN